MQAGPPVASRPGTRKPAGPARFERFAEVIRERLHPLAVLVHHQRVRHAQLPGHEIQHRARNVQRIIQERPQPADSHQLQRETDPHVVTAPLVNEIHVLVIQEEHPLQVRLRRIPRVPAVRRRLIIRQELNWHKTHRNGATTTLLPRAIQPLQVHAPTIEPHQNRPGQ